MESLEAVLAETCVSSLVFEPETFERLAVFGRSVVESTGIRGQDADALVQRVLSELRTGPLVPEGRITLRAALRHRLHLAAIHFWRGERRRRAALVRAAEARRSHGQPTPEPVGGDLDLARVRIALEHLPPSDREALRLAYLSALPLDQVRRILGYRSLDVLYVRLSQARARLREVLGSAEAP